MVKKNAAEGALPGVAARAGKSASIMDGALSQDGPR